MRTPPIVSVITPVYNSAAYLAETIDSIRRQTLTDWELLLIDDGSTDTSWEIIEAAAASEPRIRAFRNDANRGIPFTRNRAVAEARGSYIAWLDADDVATPDRLETQVAFMDAHPRVGICGAWIALFQGQTALQIKKFYESDTEIRRHAMKFTPVNQGTAIVRTEIMKSIGPFDNALPVSEDLDMIYRIGRDHEFANIQEVLMRYRQHDGSATRSRLRLMLKTTLQIRRRFHRSGDYRMTASDRLVYAATAISLLLPTGAVMRLFQTCRARVMGLR